MDRRKTGPFGQQWAVIKRSPVFVAAALALGYLFTAQLGLGLVIYPGGAPSTWLAGSFLAAAFMLIKPRWRLGFGAGAAVITFALALARHSGPMGPAWSAPHALTFTALSVGEAYVAAWLTLRQTRTPRIGNMKQAGRMIGKVVLPTVLLFAVAAGLTHRLMGGLPWTTTFTQWLVGHLVGMATMLPTLILLATPARTKPPAKSMLEMVLLVGSVLIFVSSNFSALGVVTFLLILPAATIFAFRLGPKATVVTLLALTTLSDAAGYIHPNLNAWGTPMSIDMIILVGQCYLTFVFMNGLFTGLAVDHQARMKALLELKTAIARRAHAKAIKASRAKTDFLATMSHEIRTPLNGVIGFTQVLLKREGLEPDVREQIELIGSSGYALLTVVNDILDFSKVEAGQVSLDPRPRKLADVAREAIAIVGPEAERKQLDLDLVIQGRAEVSHLVDDQRVRQILINLLNNAVKFTTEGGVRLTLKITASHVRFEIRDTGAGIAADALPRLFQRFSQADNSITRTHGGTGLGLAISKGLVELMGGEIGVKSKRGQGSTFWFQIALPRVEGDETQAEEEVEAPALSAHILLVDDHPVNRQLGVTVLNLLGCTAETAENGEVAVQAMRTGRYDLILMDVHMPVMDGLEATRAIRALGGAAGKTPIITMSADVLPEQVARFQAVGMDDWVSKPLDIQDLYACIARWTRTRGGAGASESAAA